jgi:hypothetical protein
VTAVPRSPQWPEATLVRAEAAALTHRKQLALGPVAAMARRYLCAIAYGGQRAAQEGAVVATSTARWRRAGRAKLRIELLGIGAMKSPRYRPAGLLLEFAGHAGPT